MQTVLDAGAHSNVLLRNRGLPKDCRWSADRDVRVRSAMPSEEVAFGSNSLHTRLPALAVPVEANVIAFDDESAYGNSQTSAATALQSLHPVQLPKLQDSYAVWLRLLESSSLVALFREDLAGRMSCVDNGLCELWQLSQSDAFGRRACLQGVIRRSQRYFLARTLEEVRATDLIGSTASNHLLARHAGEGTLCYRTYNLLQAE